MAVSVTMPRLGESVTEGTVTRWLKKEGESVQADEPLLEVSTDKVDTEIPAPASGVLTSIKVSEDETVEVGAELAVIDAEGTAAAPAESGEAAEPAEAAAESGAADPESAEETEPAEARTEAPPAPQNAPDGAAAAGETFGQDAGDDDGPTHEEVAARAEASVDSAPAPAPTPSSDDDGKPSYVTPLVRKLASEHGVDLGAVTGTGVGGRIRKQDVLDAAKGGGSRPATSTPAAAPAAKAAAPAAPAARAAAPAPRAAAPSQSHLRGKTEKLSRLRTVIAQRMVESLQVSAQLTTVVEVDVTRIARLRDAAKAEFDGREGTKLSFLPFFAVAAIEALKAYPVVNSSIDLAAGTVTYHDGVHLGIAVDTDRGLLVPVIQDAGDLNLGGIARKVADLADRTRSNRVTPDELGGGTFTLTNTGSRGALFDTPIINQPQVAILGTGSVVKRPVVVEDPDLGEVVAVRSMVYLALSYDHRIVDGADAARYLSAVKERLEEGAFEAELGLDA
ncbi:MAG TPA: 2-oxoglutarate dehydrogenase, E2 component, dihydrolipoamide succinyltransferase [Frankiaceae bacterium]|nr:2-oxoglutarate dehydrogenase, E2 component, dihydrolipoamide succinyltransferase [Frankiaceae bacterium]